MNNNNSIKPIKQAGVIRVLGALGVPTAIGGYFLGPAKENIPLLIFLFVIYEMLIFIGTMATSVVGILKVRWAKELADYIDCKRQEVFSRYYKKYMENIRYQFRDFDMKGMSTQGPYTLDVNDVFVELRIAPGFIHQLSLNIIENKSSNLTEEPRDIWSYIKSVQENKQNSLVIIGAPGTGKTTLLRHIALIYSCNNKYRKTIKVSPKIPILLYLREHAKAITGDPEPNLLQIVEMQINKWGLRFLKSWFEAQLEGGRMIILLDGLDEVADAGDREKLSNWLQRQIKNYGNNLFILSSRPHGYRKNTISCATVLEIKPFNRNQVETFIKQWYRANEIMSRQKNDPGVLMVAEREAKELISRIVNNSSLAALSVNPLLLTMIATVHRYKSSLPGRRVELYDEICDVFLGNHQRARGMSGMTLDFTPGQKKSVLQVLAYWLMKKEVREFRMEDVNTELQIPIGRVNSKISVQEFLKMIEESSGILVERENGEFAFAHLTFQEYLCAVYICEQKLEKEIIPQIGNPWWHEMILLYVAKTDATTVIRECIKLSGTSPQVLALCIECNEEAREVDPEVRMQLEKILEEGIEDTDSERRKIIAKAILALRIKNMTRIDDERSVDHYYITHAEYQLFLDDMRVRNKYFQPDHWKQYTYEKGMGRQAVVGVRPSDAEAFCQWLTEEDQEGYVYRLPNGELVEEVAIGGEKNSKKIHENKAPGFWSKKAETIEFVRESVLQDISVEEVDEHFNEDTYKYFNIIVNIISNHTRVGDLTGANNLADDLDHDLAFARDRAHDLAYDLARTLAGAHDRAFARDRTLAHAHDLDHDLARAFDLADAFDHDLADAFACDLARAFAHDLDGVLDLDRDFDFALDLALDHDLARAFYRDFDHARAHARDRDLDHTFDHDCALSSIRSVLLIHITYLIFKCKENKKLIELLRTKMGNCIYSYIIFAILEKRVKGKSPAIEGIRIVREKKK